MKKIALVLIVGVAMACSVALMLPQESFPTLTPEIPTGVVTAVQPSTPAETDGWTGEYVVFLDQDGDGQADYRTAVPVQVWSTTVVGEEFNPPVWWGGKS